MEGKSKNNERTREMEREREGNFNLEIAYERSRDHYLTGKCFLQETEIEIPSCDSQSDLSRNMIDLTYLRGYNIFIMSFKIWTLSFSLSLSIIDNITNEKTN